MDMNLSKKSSSVLSREQKGWLGVGTVGEKVRRCIAIKSWRVCAMERMNNRYK